MILSPYKISENFVLKKLQFINNGNLKLNNHDGKEYNFGNQNSILKTEIKILNDKGVEVIERHILPSEMEDFEQCWLTGTAAEVTPVGQVEQYNFEVGALTREVSREYESMVRQ